MTPDLKTLANMPGAGKATDELRKAGCWDETDGGTIVCEWEVRVTTFTEVETWVIVTAMTAKDAAEKAENKAERDAEWELTAPPTNGVRADLPNAPIGPADESNLT